jgi:hypothetical protein
MRPGAIPVQARVVTDGKFATGGGALSGQNGLSLGGWVRSLGLNSSPEVIRLTVMIHIRYPLSLRRVEDLMFALSLRIGPEKPRNTECPASRQPRARPDPTGGLPQR